MKILDEEFMTPKELEQFTGLKMGTLANWRTKNKGPSYLKLGRRVLYTKKEINKWLKKQIVHTDESMNNENHKIGR